MYKKRNVMKTEIIKRKTSYPQIDFELVFVKVKGVNSDYRISWRIFLFRFAFHRSLRSLSTGGRCRETPVPATDFFLLVRDPQFTRRQLTMMETLCKTRLLLLAFFLKMQTISEGKDL